jgi:phenolic acid decarboxylase
MKKYYLEVIGGSRALYTVVCDEMTINKDNNRCYQFYINNELMASYPIHRTIIRSIEIKDEK